MATIVVNGTSIQAAINASALSGDEVVVRDVVAYQGFDITKNVHVRAESGRFRVTSPLNPVGDANVINMKAAGAKLTGADVSGAMGKHGSCVSMVAADQVVTNVVAHDSERGYGIRVYGAAAVRPKLLNVEVHHTAIGIFIDGGGGDGLVDNPVIHHIDKMLVNDPTANNDTGGQAMGFKRNNGLVTVNNPQFDRNYSVKRTTGPDPGEPASWDYGWDGAQFELYESGPVLITGGRVFGSPILVETGRGTGAECRDFTIRGTEVWGEWPGAIPADPNQAGLVRTNKGVLLRTAVNFTFEDLEFHQMDAWIFNLTAGGGYAGTLSGIRIINNKAWLKPGVNNWFGMGSGVPMTAVAQMDGNQIYHDGAVVANVAGRGPTSDRAVFQSWTGWEATSYWGPEVVTPPDPCATVTAERDAAIAAHDVTLGQLAAANASLSVANASLGSMTAQRDAATVTATAVTSKLAQAKALAAQITAL